MNSEFSEIKIKDKTITHISQEFLPIKLFFLDIVIVALIKPSQALSALKLATECVGVNVEILRYLKNKNKTKMIRC